MKANRLQTGLSVDWTWKLNFLHLFIILFLKLTSEPCVFSAVETQISVHAHNHMAYISMCSISQEAIFHLRQMH